MTTTPSSQKFAVRKPYILLFAATIGKDAATLAPIVFLMTFNKDYVDLFTSGTTTERGLRWNNHLATRSTIRQKIPLDLNRRTNLPYFAQMTSQVMMTMEWKEAPWSRDVKYIGSQLTLYNYMAPPRDPSSASGRAYALALD